MNLYIARHGQTKLNAEHRAQGRNGEPLNEVGIEQAKELKKKFDAEKLNLIIYILHHKKELYKQPK